MKLTRRDFVKATAAGGVGIAAPMIGGIFTSFLLELIVYPAIYEIWKWHFEIKPGLEVQSSPIPPSETPIT